ncbi:MAG TPA: pseudouridine synthase [Devosiaceae bacterium]|nr:pseudouridine synthase [Devosiaceae bacterium]
MTDSPAGFTAGDRLAKVMARSGLCSRRDAEEWIKAGRVVVNGRKVLTPAFNVQESDQIVVDGVPLAERQGTRVWLYHKPKGLVVTEKDPEGRPTVFESLEEKGLPRVLSVGRLDINTEGLLLLTNDGGLKRVLELPATGWLRKYRVRAHGTITQAQLDGLKQGMEVEGIQYGPIEATLEREQGANVWLELALREGKNREVKNVLGALGLEVNRLIRISFGPFQLGDLPIGSIEAVKPRVLKDQLGRRLASEAGADFESEMPNAAPPRQGRSPAGAEREFGRGTHTATIGQQRFRFTDRAERTPAEMEEVRRQRPRHDRPGGGTAGSRRPAPGRARPEEAGPVRQIHFDDGREPVEFEEKSYGKKPRPGDRSGPPPAGDRRPSGFGGKPSGFGGKPSGFAGKPRSSGEGAGRPFGDRPPRPRSAGDEGRPARPFRQRPEGDESRPARAFKPRAAGDDARGPRKFGDKPRFPRGPRGDNDRSERPAGAARPFRGDGEDKPRAPRPFRSDGDKPRAPRSFGGRPGGDAADRPRSPRPVGDKPRGGRPGGPARPGSSRPPGGAGRPGGSRPPRKDGPPRPPRPRRGE